MNTIFPNQPVVDTSSSMNIDETRHAIVAPEPKAFSTANCVIDACIEFITPTVSEEPPPTVSSSISLQNKINSPMHRPKRPCLEPRNTSLSLHDKQYHYTQCLEKYLASLETQFAAFGKTPPSLEYVDPNFYHGLSSRSIKSLLTFMTAHLQDVKNRALAQDAEIKQYREQDALQNHPTRITN
ncbi:hypothetical protein GALMADRAFT_259944 [Galerina marginata CBS 339.88]|uniref:Uncharacterized protein n=1 Tax=Galerina marginata (strain CBS 339.88) TaxID=685588 RepID=A0A067S591_GALM3|nr:hypothetical protein GALMADRAFT_259944 [Galerina marginata CBS 339.88]